MIAWGAVVVCVCVGGGGGVRAGYFVFSRGGPVLLLFNFFSGSG